MLTDSLKLDSSSSSMTILGRSATAFIRLRLALSGVGRRPGFRPLPRLVVAAGNGLSDLDDELTHLPVAVEDDSLDFTAGALECDIGKVGWALQSRVPGTDIGRMLHSDDGPVVLVLSGQLVCDYSDKLFKA